MYTKFQSDIKWRVGRNWTTQLVSQGGAGGGGYTTKSAN